MRAVVNAFGRALLSQFHLRMLLLTILPFLFSVVIWGCVLYFGLNPLFDEVQQFFVAHDGFKIAGGILAWIGLSAIKAFLVPLIAMWLLLPLMILTALACIGIFAMPVIVRHVSSRHYAHLEPREGGSFVGSLWLSFSSFILFLLLWIVTLPLSAIPPLGLAVQALLWGWLTYRVVAYDALATHADAQELKIIYRQHRWPLLLIGVIGGALGAAPTLLWLGGALWGVILVPVLAPISIWLYVLIFTFTGLWFEYYCLDALGKYRAQAAAPAVSVQASDVPMKDIN